MSNYENESKGLGPGLFIGMAVCAMVGTISAALVRDQGDNRVHDVQFHNEQIQDELDRAHTVGRLILNDRDHTFSFVNEAQDGTPETCTGKYEVQNDAAHVVGDLACTQMVPAAPHS